MLRYGKATLIARYVVSRVIQAECKKEHSLDLNRGDLVQRVEPVSPLLFLLQPVKSTVSMTIQSPKVLAGTSPVVGPSDQMPLHHV